jgi:very-short-patch-repair endonuclease
MRFVHDNRIMRDRRRELRKNSTEAEELMWFELRNNKLGPKFKRQHSIGGYIADFYCQKYKLIIELDGEVHNTVEAKEYDGIRENYFKEQGYRVLRFSNKEVGEDMENVLQKIKEFNISS